MNMKKQLTKALNRSQLVDMVYMAKSGEITKRRLKIIKVSDDSFQAFCFTRYAKRTFIFDNILAVNSVFQKEREVGWTMKTCLIAR